MIHVYHWSGANNPVEIRALSKHGKAVGVAICHISERGIAELARLAWQPIVASVAQSRGRPIVFIDRKRNPSLPSGDVRITINGAELVASAAKIAINAARVAAGGVNVLGDALRGLFGVDAGKAGAGHKVALRRTAAGWEMTARELGEIAASGVDVFVDSGAYSESKFNAPHKCTTRQKACKAGECIGKGSLPYPDHPALTWVRVKPIHHADWLKILDRYDRIAAAGLGSRLSLVAPDAIGNQEETLRRLARYRDRVAALRATGARIIVPIQRGELSQVDMLERATEALGFSDFTIGIPSKKAASSPAEIAAFARTLPNSARVHFLGLGIHGPRYTKVMRAIKGIKLAAVSFDSVRIRALVGKAGGRKDAPRILTVLRERVRAEVSKLGWDEGAIYFEALDRYLTTEGQGT